MDDPGTTRHVKSIAPTSFMLAAPLLPGQDAWLATLEDHVYTIEEGEQTGEGIVVRYRLVEPF